MKSSINDGSDAAADADSPATGSSVGFAAADDPSTDQPADPARAAGPTEAGESEQLGALAKSGAANSGSGRSAGARIGSFFGTAHGLVLVIGAVFLGVFIGIVPPGFGLDEQTHFYRMYQISQGKLFPEFNAEQQKFLVGIPRPIYDLLQKGWYEGNTVNRERPFYQRQDVIDTDGYRGLEAQTVDPNDLVETDITQTLPNFPIVYFASAGGLAVARALGADVGTMVLAAKICAALMYLGLVFLAVWYARRLRLRWLVLTVALLPAAIFQASVISADTFANGVALLFLSITITLMIERKPVGTGTLILLAAAAAGVVLSKPTYALLVGLVAAVPVAIFPTPAKGRIYKAAVLVGALLLIALTLYIANKGTLAINSQRPDAAASISAVGQIKDLLAHPAHVVVVIGTTVIIYSESWVQGVVGLFGYNTIAVPAPFVFLTVVALALAAFHAERLRRGPAWAVLVAGVAVSLAIIMTFYLTYTEIGAQTAQGIQGRYFIPCVLAVALGASCLVPARLVMKQSTARVLFVSLPAVTLTVAAAAYAMALF